jgi:hypothetical protein
MIVAQAGKLFALPPETAHKLIKEVVYNELQDRVQESFWEYRVEKLIDHQNLTEEQVETRVGRVYRVIAKNGVPLDQAQQQQEDARLDSLLHNPGELQKAKEQYEKDEQRLRRLMPCCLMRSYVTTMAKTAAIFGSDSTQIPHSKPRRTRHAFFTDLRGKCGSTRRTSDLSP